MSQSPKDERQIDVQDYESGWMAVHAMLRAGASLSGRERHCSFLNTGRLPLADVSAVSGLDFPDDGRGLAVVDWDQDGALDLFTTCHTGPRVRFLHNRTKTHNHFLAVRLEGTTCNRDAIGARVEVVNEKLSGFKVPSSEARATNSTGDTSSDASHSPLATRHAPLIQTLYAGDAFLAQSSKWLHFGLGPTTSIVNLRIRWPDGSQETIGELEVDRRYLIRQGTGIAEVQDGGNRVVQLAATKIAASPVSEQARIVVAPRMTMPPLYYIDSRGSQVALRTTTQSPVLINLWASSCLPCIHELTDFAAHAEALRDAGVNIVALSVEPSTTSSEATSLLTKLKWPFAAGTALPRMVDALDILQRGLLDRHRPLPLPSSFLVDGNNRLVAIYKGPIASSQLLYDLQTLTAPGASNRDAAAHFPGQWISRPPVPPLLALAEMYLENGFTDIAGFYLSRMAPRQDLSGSDGATAKRNLAKIQLKLASALNRQGKHDEAIAAYRRAIQLDTNFAVTHHELGLALSRQGHRREGIPHLEQALRIDPEYADAHSNLGATHHALGNLDEAIHHYREAIAREPSHAIARHNLGRLLAARGQTDDAIEQFRKVTEITPDDYQAHRNFATQLHAQGSYSEAISAYRASLRLNPRQEPALYGLGLACVSAGDRQCAMRQYESLKSFNSTRASELLAAIRKRWP